MASYVVHQFQLSLGLSSEVLSWFEYQFSQDDAMWFNCTRNVYMDIYTAFLLESKKADIYLNPDLEFWTWPTAND